MFAFLTKQYFSSRLRNLTKGREFVLWEKQKQNNAYDRNFCFNSIDLPHTRGPYYQHSRTTQENNNG